MKKLYIRLMVWLFGKYEETKNGHYYYEDKKIIIQ